MGNLKSLTIQGFKTFPDKITLDVQDGVTAVVGPNGSGKSNIGEAVRWVLGEQSSRSLRGTLMGEMIFAGSSVQRAAVMAEVQLIFDNADHS